MQMFKLVVIEQNVSLNIDFDKQTLSGWTNFKVQLDKSTQVDEKQRLILTFTQSQIEDIYLTDLSGEKIPKDLINLKLGLIPTPLAQSQFLQEQLPIPLSIENYLIVMNKQQFSQYDKTQIHFQINTKNYEQVKLHIKYVLKNPVSGLKFIKYVRSNVQHFSNFKCEENYLYTEKSIQNSKSWLPQLHNNALVNKIQIIAPSGYLALSSGTLLEEIHSEEDDKTVFIYQLNKKIKLEKLGICVGKFAFKQIENNYIFYSPNLFKAEQKIQNTSLILQEVFKFTQDYSPDYFLKNNYSLVVIPAINIHSNIINLQIQQENIQSNSFTNIGINFLNYESPRYIILYNQNNIT